MDTLRHTTGYLNAGGRGTRLAGVFTAGDKGIAKALLSVGEPSTTLVDHHITRMGKLGYGGIVVAAGDQFDVHDYVRSRYANYPEVVSVKQAGYNGSAGDLLLAIQEQRVRFLPNIIVQNVDTILDINDENLALEHQVRASTDGMKGTLSLTRNQGVPNLNAFHVGHNSKILFSHETSEASPDTRVEADTLWRGSSTGTVALDTEYLANLTWSHDGTPVSLYKMVLGSLVAHGTLAAYDNGTNFFQDVGTVQSWHEQVIGGAIQPHLYYEHSQPEAIGEWA
ncbi:MAG: hypothetical protein ACREGB_05590 [Candidatus Saccharimonadales bacterium]